jgi:glutamate-1-semialdehyde 2,1-aminomutase
MRHRTVQVGSRVKKILIAAIRGIMIQKDYGSLLGKLSSAYSDYAPLSAEAQEQAIRTLVDGGSHTKRLIDPFPPRLQAAQGAYVTDLDGHRILDFWQGHYANILGHNPPQVTRALAEALEGGWGLQTGFLERSQTELAEILCATTPAKKVRFTTSGTLATMYAILLARAFTGRELVLKVGGGWHGGHLWGLKGVGHHDRGGLNQVEGRGIPEGIAEDVLVTCFNDPQQLEDAFKAHGDRLACFIVEPVIGAGGMMPAHPEFLQTARRMADRYGALLIFDEVISGFRFRAGDVGLLYGVQPDLLTLGKIIGGGMPVAAVGGRAEIMDLVGKRSGGKVKFTGGTYSGHPLSMLAAVTLLRYLVANESEIYPKIEQTSKLLRESVMEVFASAGVPARWAGGENSVLPHPSINMLCFPFREDAPLDTPDQVLNPEVCDLQMTEVVIKLAMLLEEVHLVHGLGGVSAAHTEEDIHRLRSAFGRALERIKQLGG